MAKAKTGGSRAYLRGRVGSDVYSIGMDAKGKKQQVVRSLAESVKNPQTQAQMRGRMIMSTVMQAVSALRPIIDHSFDNVPAGQPAISEFVKRNYALIKDDIQNHPSSGNAFGLNRYQEKGAKQGAYVISVGSAIGVKGIVIDGASKTLTIDLTGQLTIGGLKQTLGINSNDYFTACAILANGRFAYERFHITNVLADDVVISASNVAEIFTVEGNTTVAIALTGSSLVATLGEFSENNAIITSRKEQSGFIHSGVTLAAVQNPTYTSDVALPTYPVGKERFLNGGGEEEGDSPFVPEPREVSASVAPSGAGSVTGAGTYLQGESCTLVATPASGKFFAGWYNGAQLVSSNATYTFVVHNDVTLTAQFTDQQAGNFANVKVGSQSVSQNGMSVSSTDSINGSYNGTGQKQASNVWLSAADVAVGADVPNKVGNAPISNGSFNLSGASVADNVTYYLYAVRDLDGEGDFTAIDKFEYNFKGLTID